MLDIELIELLTLVLAFLSAWQYVSRNDEFPMLLAERQIGLTWHTPTTFLR